jgi:hypothetical protein
VAFPLLRKRRCIDQEHRGSSLLACPDRLRHIELSHECPVVFRAICHLPNCTRLTNITAVFEVFAILLHSRDGFPNVSLDPCAALRAQFGLYFFEVLRPHNNSLRSVIPVCSFRTNAIMKIIYERECLSGVGSRLRVGFASSSSRFSVSDPAFADSGPCFRISSIAFQKS